MTGSLPFLKTYQSFLPFVHWAVSYFLRADPSFPNIRSKHLINIQITDLSSSIAKPFSGQLAGPWENGINAEGLSLVPLTLPFWSDLFFSSWSGRCCDASNQRSGQKLFGYEKLRGSLWTDQKWIRAWFPSGIKLSKEVEISIRSVVKHFRRTMVLPNVHRVLFPAIAESRSWLEEIGVDPHFCNDLFSSPTSGKVSIFKIDSHHCLEIWHPIQVLAV